MRKGIGRDLIGHELMDSVEDRTGVQAVPHITARYVALCWSIVWCICHCCVLPKQGAEGIAVVYCVRMRKAN